MKTSERGIKLITQREGSILHVYKDSKGLPTFGVGHLVTSAEHAEYPVGKKITQETSDRYLKQDLKECEDAVNSTGELLQNEFDALVSVAFNIGVAGFKHSTIVKRLKAGNKKGAAAAILLWDEPPEIRGRRRGEYNQFLTPYKTSAPVAPMPEPVVSFVDVPPATSPDAQAGPSGDTTAPAPITAKVETTVVETSEGEQTTKTVTTASSGEPVTVKTVAVGLWTKIMTGIGILTGVGINFGTLVQTKLENLTLPQAVLIAVGVALFIFVVWYYKTRQQAADGKTHSLIDAAADKGKNTVVLEK